MGRARVGGKAGAVAGIVFGILAALLTDISFSEIKSEVLEIITKALPANSPITAAEAYPIFLAESTVIAIVLGVIFGVILGAIYGALFDRLPGKTGLVKAMVLGLIFWLLDGVLVGLAYLNYGGLFYGERVVGGLVIALFFGYLLARFYRRFSPQAVVVEPESHVP